MTKQKKTSQKNNEAYEPNKIAFGVASVAALSLVVFATLMVTSVI